MRCALIVRITVRSTLNIKDKVNIMVRLRLKIKNRLRVRVRGMEWHHQK